MSWAETLSINSNLGKPLDTKIDEAVDEIQSSLAGIENDIWYKDTQGNKYKIINMFDPVMEQLPERITSAVGSGSGNIRDILFLPDSIIPIAGNSPSTAGSGRTLVRLHPQTLGSLNVISASNCSHATVDSNNFIYTYYQVDANVGRLSKRDGTKSTLDVIATNEGPFTNIVEIKVGSDGYVYLLSSSILYKINAETLVTAETYISNYMACMDVDKDGYIYVGTSISRGRIHKIDPGTMQQIAITPDPGVGREVASISIGSNDKIYAILGGYLHRYTKELVSDAPYVSAGSDFRFAKNMKDELLLCATGTSGIMRWVDIDSLNTLQNCTIYTSGTTAANLTVAGIDANGDIYPCTTTGVFKCRNYFKSYGYKRIRQ